MGRKKKVEEPEDEDEEEEESDVEEAEMEDEEEAEEPEEQKEKKVGRGRPKKVIAKEPMDKLEYRNMLKAQQEKINSELEEIDMQDKQKEFFRTAQAEHTLLKQQVSFLMKKVENLDSSFKMFLEK